MPMYRAGGTVEQFCRACKIDRLHTIIVVDGSGQPVRVQCDFCGSQHNSRGSAPQPSRPQPPAAASSMRLTPPPRPPIPPVTDRERAVTAVDVPELGDLEILLRRIIREEAGLTPVAPAEKWRNGTLVLRPANTALQEKTWPIETFFHKVVMIRNRLRTLEQQINAMAIPEDEKVRLQGYITGCYGSLVSFNVLFADEEDQFRGTSGE